MSIRVVDWVLREAPVTDATEALVLVGLANHADDHGKDCFPSQSTIATYARCTERTVRTKLKSLEDAGVILRGDQNKVAHYPGNRRPVVWDIDLSVERKILPPTDESEGNELPPSEPDSRGENISARKSTTVRGEIHDTQGGNGFPTNRPITIQEPSSVVVNSPEADVPQHHHGGGMPQSKRWTPSDAALRTATETVTETDIPLHITRYIIVKAEQGREPSSSEWLKWLIEDEKKARVEAKAKFAESTKSGSWYGVAE